MSKWIDADALINDLEHDIAIDEDILAYVGTDQITRATTQFDKDCKQSAIDLLIHAPTIDIVRCQDCKKSHIDGKTTHYLWCTEWGRSTDTFGYCERGEREGE